ncbi:MAG: hypothetical protein ABIN37_00080 [Burkholderiaceae bacterium]
MKSDRTKTIEALRRAVQRMHCPLAVMREKLNKFNWLASGGISGVSKSGRKALDSRDFSRTDTERICCNDRRHAAAPVDHKPKHPAIAYVRCRTVRLASTPYGRAMGRTRALVGTDQRAAPRTTRPA